MNVGQSDRIRVRVPEAEVEFIERGRHGYDPSRKVHQRGNTRRQRKILVCARRWREPRKG